MNTRKMMQILFFGGVFVLLFAACNAVPAEKIRIGLIAPITGDLAVTGQFTVDAAKMAVDEINAAGGLMVDGRQHEIELLIEDNQDNPEVATSAAQKLINQDKVVAIIGPQASRNAIPVARVAENSGIPMITPYSTNPETTRDKKFVFRAAYTDLFQGSVLARFVFEELKLTKAAVLYDIASPYNRGVAEIFRDSFEAAGGQVVAFESYTTGEGDFRPQLQRIAASGAQVLLLPNYYTEIEAQVTQSLELGLQVQYLGSDTWTTVSMDTLLKIEGAFTCAHYSVESTEPIAQTFVKNFQQRYSKLPEDVAALTYDAFGLLFDAIQRQGEFTPEAIRDGLANGEGYQGVTGLIQYRGSGDPVKSAVILQARDGKFVFYKQFNP
ncbi:MAG: ABC transporter substrate-binding protein [Anaerolineales bacterium]